MEQKHVYIQKILSPSVSTITQIDMLPASTISPTLSSTIKRYFNRKTLPPGIVVFQKLFAACAMHEYPTSTPDLFNMSDQQEM